MGDYFISGDLTDVDDVVAAATRRLDVQPDDYGADNPGSGSPPTIGYTRSVTEKRCSVTRRQRIDLALLLIIRRAERDAAVPGPSRVAQPDAPTASTSPNASLPQAPQTAGT